MRCALVAAVVAATLVAPRAARAERDPWQPGTPAASFARPGGRVRVHYVTTTVDAVPTADTDASGIPDFVEEVARRGDESLAAFAALGFRMPLADGALGGDDRLDIYLQDLAGADGAFMADTCTRTPFHCSGSMTMENDFVGYPYPSASMGIRVLTSHELFHAVQEAYDGDQPVAWSEGTAVWAEEVVFPEQGDFEALVAAFQAKPFRPFDRPGAGFGDLYPYGAALWPYFLEAHVGAGTVAAAWAGCEDHGDDPDFLDALDALLTARGRRLTDEWITFTRWNARTGARADGTSYPEAGRLALALRQPALAAPGAATAILEGFSARYLPITGVGESSRITVTAQRPVAIEVRPLSGTATITRVGDDVTALSHTLDVVPAAEAVDLEVVISSAVRGGIQQETRVEIAPYTPPPPEEEGGCGCRSSGSDQGGLWLGALVVGALVRRPAGRRRSRCPLTRRAAR